MKVIKSSDLKVKESKVPERTKTGAIQTSELDPDTRLLRERFLISQALPEELEELARKVNARLKREIRVVFAKCPKCKWRGRLTSTSLAHPCLSCNPYADEDGGHYEEMSEEEIKRFLADEESSLRAALKRAKEDDEISAKLANAGAAPWQRR